MPKLYTRTGDDGTTGLFGGGRVGKDHPRMEAIGAVDELNAAIGWAGCAVVDGTQAGSPAPLIRSSFQEILSTLQSRLFDLGADLATPLGSKHEDKVSRISAADVSEAEGWIDQVDGGNTPMTQFVLPGGTELAARLHLARTICRRAERRLIALSGQDAGNAGVPSAGTTTVEVNPNAIIYINRISDLLFAMARRANKEAGVADVPWHKRTHT